MLQLILGFVLGAYFMYCWSFPKVKSVKGGYRADIILPHTEEVELYYNTFSSCSQKVRACLGEAGIKFKSHHVDLPSSGSWVTKKAAYLNVNPAGTVPVLVHNGHPIYESHEQIIYISQNLMPEKAPELEPVDPEMKALMTKWVEIGAMVPSEVFGANDPWSGIQKRMGNLLPLLTMPLFAAITLNFSLLTFLEHYIMFPMVDNQSRKMILGQTIFKLFGAEGMQKLGIVYEGVKMARKGLVYHFEKLDKDLQSSGGPFICGNQYTLADISLLPILQRMEVVQWWPSVENEFPSIKTYFDHIKSRPGYQGSLPSSSDSPGSVSKMASAQTIIKQWKVELPWFRALYDKH